MCYLTVSDMHDGINILICMMETIWASMYDGTNIERAMEPYHVMNLDFRIFMINDWFHHTISYHACFHHSIYIHPYWFQHSNFPNMYPGDTMSVSKVRSKTRNLASMVDEQLSICRALRSDATVQQVLNLNKAASTKFIEKQCVYLVQMLKADIRALHEKIEFSSNDDAAEVFNRTRQLEDSLHQTKASSDPTEALSAILKLLELKESFSVKILSHSLKLKHAFDEECVTANSEFNPME